MCAVLCSLIIVIQNITSVNRFRRCTFHSHDTGSSSVITSRRHGSVAGGSAPCSSLRLRALIPSKDNLENMSLTRGVLRYYRRSEDVLDTVDFHRQHYSYTGLA